MILGTKELLRRVKDENLVENLCERELVNPEGSGFDIRVGKVYRIKDKGFLGIEERATPKTEILAEYDEKKSKNFALRPSEYVLIETIEKVNTPADLLGLFIPRSTLMRSGVWLYCGQASPGFCGKLTFGLHNKSNEPFEIEMGARIAQVVFHQVSGEIHNAYHGQWPGGRISSQGQKENQI